jgi:hypothetical protein
MTAGGGLDVRVHRHIAIRIIQAEYMMTRFENLDTGSSALQNDIRLSTGIVFRFGGNGPPLPPPSPLSYSCSVNPLSVFPGDAIAVSGTALNLNPAKTALYTWSVDGGTVPGAGGTGKIDTTSLAPGAYTLKGHESGPHANAHPHRRNTPRGTVQRAGSAPDLKPSKGRGKGAGWKSQKDDFLTPLANPANYAGFALYHRRYYDEMI